MTGLTVLDTATRELTPEALDVVRDLSAQGVFPHSIRRALGLTPSQWKVLMKAPPGSEDGISPLALAMREGRAEGAGETVALIRAAARGGDLKAAMWLGEKVYKIGSDANHVAQDTGPRLTVVIPAPMSVDEYAKVLEAGGYGPRALSPAIPSTSLPRIGR